MSILQAFILGLIQGLTEFLPVSSSGHLILIPYIFHWDIQPLYFDVALHLGTLIAVALFFWKDWKAIFSSLRKNWKIKSKQDFLLYPIDTRLGILIGMGTIPAVIIGFLFQDIIESTLRSPLVVVAMLILVGGLMWWVENKPRVVKSFKNLKPLDGFLIGVSQAIALIPGTSRSGVTITAGIFRGLSREDAARFSFLLSTPIIFGAGVYEIYKVFKAGLQGIDVIPLVVGFLTSSIMGLLAIKFLMDYLKKQKLTLFIIYRIGLALLILGFLLLNY